MKAATVNVHEAKTQMSKLIARAEKGERITIARAGKAVAQLGPLVRTRRRRNIAIDPLLQVDEYSFDGPVGKLTNRDIDTIVYGG
jgi:antitoxin (DNA-binding transcriptional repressor) of toxin-antitoxin stability system